MAASWWASSSATWTRARPMPWCWPRGPPPPCTPVTCQVPWRGVHVWWLAPPPAWSWWAVASCLAPGRACCPTPPWWWRLSVTSGRPRRRASWLTRGPPLRFVSAWCGRRGAPPCACWPRTLLPSSAVALLLSVPGAWWTPCPPCPPLPSFTWGTRWRLGRAQPQRRWVFGAIFQTSLRRT
jgi:hypothetical protein